MTGFPHPPFMIAMEVGTTMKRICTGLAVSLLIAVPLAAKEPEAAESLLQTAIKKEVVDGNLAGAIEGYKKALAAAKGNRSVAARVLVHMADCYQKLGDKHSQEIYEHVVRDYADQKDAVAKARVRLGGIAQPGRQTNTLVWSGPKAEDYGGVSPDGRYISYTDWDTGDLALHDIATGADRRLTDTKQKKPHVNVFAEESAISRDGRQIAYNWYENNKAELRLASLTGNPNTRHLYENPDIAWYTPFDWSPDGRSLAVLLQRSDRTKNIGLISIPEGSLRVLKSLDWRGAGRIRFSPDGKYLGYDLPQNDTGPERDVFVLSVDGAREIHSVAHPSNDTMMGWSPDGKWLLFASDRTGSMGLWGLPFADGKPQGPPELLRADFAARAEPIGVTHSGALYYGIKGSQDRFKIQIASIDFDSGKYLSEPLDLTRDYLESNALPTWSPDGRQLAYKSIRGLAQKPSHEVVLIRAMDTGQIRELRPKLSYFGPMTWAPDGRSFLTLGGDLKGRAGIYQVDVETGIASTVLLDQPGERSWYPQWARDGKSFYFRRDYRLTQDSAYIQRDVATGTEKEVIRRRILLNMVDPSPDDQYLVTRSIDESTLSRTLLLIPIHGGKVRELVRYSSEVSSEDLANPRKGVWLNQGLWAADSRAFLAFKHRGDPRDSGSKGLGTWRMSINGDEPQKLADTTFRDSDVARPVVHPDRRRVAFTVKETTPPRDPEIWALDNFLPSQSAAK